jgi:hypothetical protein
VTGPSDLVSELEDSARGRFVRWDGSLWRELCGGPARALAEALTAAGTPAGPGEAILTSYLRLASEGIGLGYLFPASAGAESFFTLAWTKLIPRSLASLPLERRAEVLAECWNLGENLESGPAWLKRIFLRIFSDRASLTDLASVVADVSRQALGEPERKLLRSARPHWVHLAAEDVRFLPGSLHFLAPTVVCVHDRHRTGGGGRDPATVGAWLSDPPLFLGSMGCREPPPSDPGLRLDVLEGLEKRDPRASDRHAMAANDWRAGVTLETSQFLVALLPE